MQIRAYRYSECILLYWYLLSFFLSLENSLVFFLLRTAHVSDLHCNMAQPMRKKRRFRARAITVPMKRFIQRGHTGPSPNVGQNKLGLDFRKCTLDISSKETSINILRKCQRMGSGKRKEGRFLAFICMLFF